jgi:hypothetical protein
LGLVFPVVVESSLFSSELVLTNWSAIRKVVHLTYFADAIQTSGHAAHRYLELLPGEQSIISNFVQSLRERGIPGVTSDESMYAGMLTARVEGGDPSGIYLAARTSAPGGGGRYGVAYLPYLLMLLLPAAFGFTDSARTLSIAQIWRWSIGVTWIPIQTCSPSTA